MRTLTIPEMYRSLHGYLVQRIPDDCNTRLTNLIYVQWLGIFLVLVVLWLVFSPLPVLAQDGNDYRSIGLRIADHLLSQQDGNGAIPDAPSGSVVNQDSNMEYTLLGLAAAYWYSRDTRYLEGLEKGITWLAEREEMTDPDWTGSWFYAYSSTPPYAPVSIPVGLGIADVRGVDTTSALFVYLLYLQATLAQNNTLATQYEARARAALDFVLSHNQSPDGFFYSSWQQRENDGQWHLWLFRYSADQADVYLGLQAGWQLYGDPRYQQAADHLKTQFPSTFFAPTAGRYAVGLEENGEPALALDSFNGIFSQGYVPWVMGKNAENEAAYRWLQSCTQPDGSLSCYADDPRYSLSAALYILAAASLGYPSPDLSQEWLAAQPYDPDDGGVRDTLLLDSEEFSNVAAFTVMAFLGFPTLLEPDHPVPN